MVEKNHEKCERCGHLAILSVRLKPNTEETWHICEECEGDLEQGPDHDVYDYKIVYISGSNEEEMDLMEHLNNYGKFGYRLHSIDEVMWKGLLCQRVIVEKRS